MTLLNPEIQAQLKEVLSAMKTPVTIALFTREDPCATCKETVSYMEEVQELNSLITLQKYDLDTDTERAQTWKVEMAPSIVLLDHEEKYQGVKFNGIPAGHEINSLIPGLLEMSGAGVELPAELQTRIDAINKPINIKVFVTLGCPHCPGAVQKAHKLALSNAHIEAEMVESQTFAELAEKFEVSSVPHIVINDSQSFVGNQPFDAFIEAVEKI